MRKQTIWLIGIVLLIAFAGLLVMQFTYLSEIVSTREEQFDEAAKRALFGTMRQLERQETRKYLDEYYDDAEKQALSQLNQESSTSSVTTSGSISVQGPDGSVSTFKFQSNVGGDTLSQHHFEMQPRSNRNIQSRQRAMQDMLLGQYMYQRNLLDDVVFRIISQTNDKPIMERLDLEQLRRTLTEEMQSAGYNLDYEFCIVERDGSVAYRSAGYKAEEAEKEGSYMQMLFPRSQMAQDYGKAPSRVSYMEVYFPGRHRLLMNNGLHFMIPSFVFTLVMLMLFIFVIYVVFRQKKLSEIKNDFINNMTHEFKTPISSISLASQMLNDPAVSKSPDMVKHITGVIADETKRLRFQVEKVLQMSMFDRQKTNLKLQDIPVNAIVESACSTFRLKVEKAGGQIETHLDADDDICMVDEMHFGNVIFNLMDNAYKYSREDVPLHLTISTRNVGKDKLELRVQDNGIGIKKEDLKRIFEKFYRVPTGNVHNVKGFGLGLAYVWKIVKDHGGDIKAESTYGQGTAFIITIPLMREDN